MKPAAWKAILGAVVVLTMVRVAATDRVFSQTLDEPVHIGAGYEWLKGRYDIDLQHPPLARVLAALPLQLSGVPEPADHDWIRYGNALLGSGPRYVHNILLARLGNLPLLALAIVAVAFWSRTILSPAGALLAAALFATLPPILGHSGMATTDLAVAATLPLAIVAFLRWLSRGRWGDAVLAGGSVGLGLLSKFSFLLFFPLCAVALLTTQRLPIRWRQTAALAGAAFLVVWAGYRFEFGTLASVNSNASSMIADVTPGSLQPLAARIAKEMPLPAPSFVLGGIDVKLHDRRGHSAFLLGNTSEHGWWYYFPLAILFKTPIPFLLLALIGCAVLLRRAPQVPWAAAAILCIAMTASINIGVRHVLPVYAPMAVSAGAACIWLSGRGRIGQIAVSALLAWQLLTTSIAHPDYLAWFNGFAGSHPERVLSDSNLDWGQDLLRLARVCRQKKIDRIGLVTVSSADLDALGLPPRFIVDSLKPSSGWIAISETSLQAVGGENGLACAWVRRGRGFERVGKTIRLYHVP